MNSISPATKRFQQIKAEEKKFATLKAQIKTNNPKLSDSQVKSIAQASMKLRK